LLWSHCCCCSFFFPALVFPCLLLSFISIVFFFATCLYCLLSPLVLLFTFIACLGHLLLLLPFVVTLVVHFYYLFSSFRQASTFSCSCLLLDNNVTSNKY
jgi:hypothetical protein